MTPSLPEGWRSVPLHKILSKEQIKCVLLIIQENPDPFLRVQRLKAYLEPVRVELAEKGWNSDYLAYALEHFITKTK